MYDRALTQQRIAEEMASRIRQATPRAPEGASNRVPGLSDLPVAGRLFVKPGEPAGGDILAEIRALREENRAMQKQMEEMRRQIESLRGRRAPEGAATKPAAALEMQRLGTLDRIRKAQLVFTDKHPQMQQLRAELTDLDRQILQLTQPVATPVPANPRP